MKLSDQLEEAALPDMMLSVLAQLNSKWRKLWDRARRSGIDSLKTREKYLLMQALEKAATAAGFSTPEINSRAVDQAIAFTTSW